MGRSGSLTAKNDAKKARGELDREVAPPMKLKVGDLEDFNPVSKLIDEKKSLKLSDDQLAKLKEQRSALEQANKPLLEKFDSLRVVLRPLPHPTDEDNVRQVIARDELGVMMRSLRASYAAAEPAAMAVLDDTQKATAKDLLAAQAKETDETLRSKMGGGRMGRPPGRP